MAHLDLVVSVDTAILHLAGALGRKAWDLLPYPPDWRWLLEREDSPRHLSLRLFRQKTAGDWDPVLASIRDELVKLVAQRMLGSSPGSAGIRAQSAALLTPAGALQDS